MKFDFKVNVDDREPMHVHVWYRGKEVLITMLDDKGLISLTETHGMSIEQVRQAMRIVGENQEFFILKWREIHG